MIRTAFIVLVMAVASPAATTVAAQEVPRMFRGLFRPSDTPDASRHKVDLFTGFSYEYASAELDSDPAVSPFDLPLYSASGFGTTPIFQYSYTGQRRVFGAVAAGSFARYGSVDWLSTRYFTHMRFATPTGPRTNFSLRGLVSYTPYYTFDLSLDPEREETDLMPAFEGNPVAVRSTMFFDVSAQLRHRLSERSELGFNLGAAYTNYSGLAIDSLTPSGSVRYTRGLTEHTRLQLGYGYRQWNYPDYVLPVVRSHDIISGVSYSRPLPFARRTQVGFDIGSAIAQTPGAWRYDITGGAFILQPIKRAWVAVGSYRRGLDARAGLSAPLYLFGDTAAVTVSGLVARRVVVRTTATYVRANSLFDDLRERSQWWSAYSSLSTLLFGALAGYVQVGWTGQRFAEQAGEVTGLPTRVQRFSVSSGVSLGLPLVR
ncbi:MAG TPA: hypothetical protein VFV51_02945 [Vicinamibacterales bacterium]|nr:hypothetical protein [Vicinamibacterales bacterium]